MEALLKYLAGEGRVVLQAPFPFAICLVLSASLIWAAMDWRYSSQIANMQSRLSLKDDQVADYKAKLDGATPAEAKQRIDALELNVKALLPRRLTIEQKESISRARAETKAIIAIFRDMTSADSKAYTDDFVVAFRAAGWDAHLIESTGIQVSSMAGVVLHVKNTQSLRELEIAAKHALETAGISFQITDDASEFSTAGLPIPEPDVRMLITTRLN